MLIEKTIKFPNPTSTNYFPILADSRALDKDNKRKAEAQAAKINSIISGMFDDLTVKTTQGQKTTNYTYRTSSYRSQLVDRVKDSAYNEYANLSFDFYVINIKKDSTTPLLRLSLDSMIGNILFVGLDDINNPTDSLANYGFFTLTQNNVVGEKQLSFYASKNVPEKIYHCSLQFLVYQTTSDVSLLEAEQQGAD